MVFAPSDEICPKWWNLSQVMEFAPSDGICSKWWYLLQVMEFVPSDGICPKWWNLTAATPHLSLWTVCEIRKIASESESDTESVKYTCRVKIYLWIFSVSLFSLIVYFATIDLVKMVAMAGLRKSQWFQHTEDPNWFDFNHSKSGLKVVEIPDAIESNFHLIRFLPLKGLFTFLADAPTEYESGGDWRRSL